MVVPGATLTWVLAALYFALVGVWGLLTVGMWWRRRRAVADLAGDPPDLDAYELVRLDRGRSGQIEVMLAQLLESGVLERGARWGDPESRWFPQSKTYRVAVRSPPGPGAHELERALVRATGAAPGKAAMSNASGVTDGEPCDQIDSSDRTGTAVRRVASVGHHLVRVGLFWIGTLWSVGRMVAYGAPGNTMTSWLFIIGCGLFLPVFMSMPETAGGPDATPNGRAVVELARTRHTALRRSFAAAEVRLAVALFGAATVGPEHPGVRDTYELLAAEAERFIGL